MKTEEIAESRPPETVTLTVGTAGHIDHGKTRLVKFFTGCETDRLPEEKRRGMTIDLGFATCVLPSNRRVGIVDVPGHERFIHNMVAGAAGIDVVLLVVAADDGVMPQTIEHFHIVRMLGVTAGMVAITKTDIVSPGRVPAVMDQVEELVKGSFLEGCPITPVSSKTGDGFDAFYDAFVGTVDKTAERDASGPFRLHVERSFVLKGLGMIVSGIPISGAVRVGDTVSILPGGAEKKVRGVQVYGQTAEVGRAGECVALKLQGLSKGEAARGSVLATPRHFVPSRFVNARLQYLHGADRPLKPRTAVRFHSGTAAVPGHVVLPTLDPLPPGGESYVQLQLRDPVVCATGDFFVVRLLSPVATIGGGYVVSAGASRMRRSRGNWVEECAEHEEAFRDPGTALKYVLGQGGAEPMRLAELARRALLNVPAARDKLASLVGKGAVVAMPGEQYALAKDLEDLRSKIVSVLETSHDAEPLALGFPRKELFPKVGAPRALLQAALDELLDAGTVARNEKGYHLSDRAARLTPGQEAMARKICTIFAEAGFSTPRREDLPAAVGAPVPIVDRIVEFLIQTGTLVVISDKVMLDRAHVEESRQLLVEYLETHGVLESGRFKSILGTTRKYAIPLLEYWDAQGLTKRRGNERVLRET